MSVPAEASEKDRRKHTNELLQLLLGAEFSEAEVLQRQSLGSIVHIFSHIRMTLHVEKMAVKVGSASKHIRLVQSCPLKPRVEKFLAVDTAVH